MVDHAMERGVRCYGYERTRECRINIFGSVVVRRSLYFYYNSKYLSPIHVDVESAQNISKWNLLT